MSIDTIIKEMREYVALGDRTRRGVSGIGQWADQLEAEVRRGPVAWVDAQTILDRVKERGSYAAILWRNGTSRIGVPLFAAPQPAIPDDVRRDARRYREVRKWTPAVFTNAWKVNVETGLHFDSIVDALIEPPPCDAGKEGDGMAPTRAQRLRDAGFTMRPKLPSDK